MIVNPSFSFKSFKRLIIWALIDTSRALIGSSQINSFGFIIKALAIPIR